MQLCAAKWRLIIGAHLGERRARVQLAAINRPVDYGVHPTGAALARFYICTLRQITVRLFGERCNEFSADARPT